MTILNQFNYTLIFKQYLKLSDTIYDVTSQDNALPNAEVEIMVQPSSKKFFKNYLQAGEPQNVQKSLELRSTFATTEVKKWGETGAGGHSILG